MITMIPATDKPTVSNVFVPLSGTLASIVTTILAAIKIIARENKAATILLIHRDYR
jgi:hypothetical protein